MPSIGFAFSPIEYGELAGHAVRVDEQKIRYEGDFYANTFHSHGRFSFDTDRYKGEWSKGRPNGFGTVTFADGTSYSGEWTKGCLQGRHLNFGVPPGKCRR